MMRVQQKQAGVSLVEMMIGMVVALIVLAGVGNIYVTTIVSSAESTAMARLNQEMRAVMGIMSSDLRRAGYWSGATTLGGDIATNPNPFMAATADLQIHGGTCVLYTYDTQEDGAAGNEDYLGFRLTNGAIWMRTAGTTTSDANCTNGTWARLTDESFLNVTSLALSLNGSTCLNITTEADCSVTAPTAGDITVETRRVNITLAGQLVGDAAMNTIINQTVKIRNDRVVSN